MNRTESTETTYSLRSKLPHQRKWRLFAEYTVWFHKSRVSASVSYYNYRSGKLEQSYFVSDVDNMARQIASWASREHSRVFYSHYEVGA